MKKRVGLIGTGWYGKCDLLRLLQVAPVDVVSLCDVDSVMLADAAAQVASRQISKKSPRTYRDYREMLKENFPNGVMRMTPGERHVLRAMVYASRTVFYSLNYDDFNACPTQATTTFYIDRIGPPHANAWDSDLDADANPHRISETDPIVVEYQTRVLTKLNEMKNDRSPESRRKKWVNSNW